jgi:glyoxylase-like metal-dependent hydrolase (beta-lactamase superfamily II)
MDEAKPTAVVVTKPDHVRDVDLFVRWYGASAFGPNIFFRTDIPKTELEWLKPCDELPGGVRALHDGRFGRETPLFAPEQGALVFGDALTSLGGVLQVWWTPWFEDRTIPELRSLLELPFEHVLVSHGQPVHTRTDFEAALERPPWAGT